MKYKIGYIDEDPKQVDKYERELRANFDVIGYNIHKGLPLDELIEQVYNSEIDLLMVDYLMKEKGVLVYNGDEVARAYEEIKPRFPLIIFTNEESQAFPHVDNPFIICDKNEVRNDKKRFVVKLNKLIELYKKYVNDRKDTLSNLMEKEKRSPLTAKEKNLKLQAQQELNMLDRTRKEVPLQLLEVANFEHLSKITNEAAEFLKSIKKKSKK